MNLDVLKTYMVVIDRGSITAASRQLGISQPAVSMQIATLEEVFGSKLLTRTSYGVELTEAGKYVLNFAYEVEEIFNKTLESIAKCKGEMKGSINIAASNIPGMFVLPKRLNQFRKLYPQVNMNLEIMNSRSAIDKLLSGEVHIAAVGEKIDVSRVDDYTLIEDEITLIAPKDFHSENLESIVDLINKRVPILRRKEGSSTRKIVDSFFKEANQSVSELNVVGVFNSVIAQVNAVSEGSGVAFVSNQAISKELALNLVKIVNVKGFPIKRDLDILFREKSLRNRIEEAFYAMCKTIFIEKN
ncbi:MAG: LysR substrate-binding domain-containing protein [Clostridia bacterium]